MTKNRALYICLLLILSCYSSKAQTNLTSNAYCIVQDATTEMICDSPTSAVRKESYTITILNEKGKESAHFTCMCDKFVSLRKFSGEIQDANGKVIRKIKKSDLQMTEYSSNLTSDDYVYYYECNLPYYPITVKYEWEVKYKDGLIGYPAFVPQDRFNMAVAKASFRLQTPAGYPCRFQGVNTKANVTQKETPEGCQLTEVSFESLPAFEYENYGATLPELLPRIYFAPTRFSFDGSQGDLSTWKSYGEWQYGLLNGRNQLPDPIKIKLQELTANCKTPREKVQAVYDHLAATTRYVSIQLGIGGLQPIAASDVCRAGFGDCKGLSNYMRAMLEVLGIPSTYTVISTDNERLLPDFSSVNQMNHVILQVPLPGDTLWLECTNPQLPFGYIHDDIAGHDALLITPEGGKVYRLPSYPDSLNTQTIQANIVLSPDGKAKIMACETNCVFQYEGASYIQRLEPSKQKDLLRSSINLTHANISSILINEKKETHPHIGINYSIDTDQYGNKTGNRLFIPTNVFRRNFNVPSVQQRIQDIHIRFGYLDTDSICLQLPDGYTIESLPRTTEISEAFGSFSSTIQIKDKQIYILHQLSMKRGIFPKESYQEFIEFRKNVAAQYNGKIILRKT